MLSEDGRRLLVVRKSGRDVFILPGGQPADGEAAEETLRRELIEELGVDAVSLQPLMAVQDVAAFEDVALRMEVFRAVLDGEPTASSEIAEIAWVPADHEHSGLRLASGITRHVLPRLFPEPAAATLARPPVAVLFSGGRDSTAVALGLHERGHPLRLLTFRSGLGSDDGLLGLRLQELRAAWPAGSFTSHSFSVAGLVREICFRDLVDDVVADKRQLILLGEAVAMIVRAVRFCLDERVDTIAIGATGYQAHYPEQRPDSLQSFQRFCAGFGVRFVAPGVEWDSELLVKDRLRLAGLSAKSLESASLLGDLDDRPPEAAVQAYLGRKLASARGLVSDSEKTVLP